MLYVNFKVGVLSLASTLLYSQLSFAGSDTDSGPGTFNSLPLGNPYLSLLPKGAKPNYDYWKSRQMQGRKLGRESEDNNSVGTHPIYRDYKDIHDNEGLEQLGLNDTIDNAISLSGSNFRISGRIYTPLEAELRPTVFVEQSEDNDDAQSATQIPLLNANVEYVTEGALGDGSQQDDDFDVFKLGSLNTDLPLLIKYEQTSELSTNHRVRASLFDTELELVGLQSAVGGSFYFGGGLIEDFNQFHLALGYHWLDDEEELNDVESHYGNFYTPFDYKLTVFQAETDVDTYAFYAEEGQIISVSDSNMSLDISLRKDGKHIIAGHVPGFSIFPESSQIPRSNVKDLVYTVQESGTYTISIRSAGFTEKAQDYDVKLSILDGSHFDMDVNENQIVFLDFNGAKLNGRPFNGLDEMIELSPLADFMIDLGLAPEEENQLVLEVSKRVEAKVRSILDEASTAETSKVTFYNSLEHEDTFGQQNVSRLIVGGTEEELKMSTIGVAQSIDVGNFDKEESAIILLDNISDIYYQDSVHNLRNESTHFDLVAEVLAVVSAHELGHILSAFHTDNSNETANIMDAGGNMAMKIGSGEDEIYGTEDDVDVYYAEDELDPWEGFRGNQHTGSIIAASLHKGTPRSNSSNDDDGPLGLGSLGLGLFMLSLIYAIRRRSF